MPGCSVCGCTNPLPFPDINLSWQHSQMEKQLRLTCKDCGAIGAHFCTGERPRTAEEIIRELDLADDLRFSKDLILPTCDKHKRYQGKVRPRTPCEACWRRYIATHPA